MPPLTGERPRRPVALFTPTRSVDKHHAELRRRRASNHRLSLRPIRSQRPEAVVAGRLAFGLGRPKPRAHLRPERDSWRVAAHRSSTTRLTGQSAELPSVPPGDRRNCAFGAVRWCSRRLRRSDTGGRPRSEHVGRSSPAHCRRGRFPPCDDVLSYEKRSQSVGNLQAFR